MPCYSPLQAYKCFSGEVVFSEHKTKGDAYGITLPCGQCHGCRLERSRQWAVRCMHEVSMHERNCFITLTYSDEHLPDGGTLVYDDFQRFLKRLRKHTGPNRVRFYMCGEYGEETWRPHYHAILFGHDWDDKKAFSKSGEHQTWTSQRLDEIWGLGYCLTAGASFQSAAYISRYCLQKRTGKLAHLWYRRWDGERYHQLEPEFNHMSLKPGIGAEWLKRYHTDVYNQDYVIVNGKETKPPKYYDQLYAQMDEEHMQEIKERREIDAYERRDDNTPDRLAVKEQVSKAAIAMLQRNKQ